PPAVPKLVAIAGRDEAAVKEAALRYGYEGYYTDWRKMLADPRVQLFDNAGPNNLHAEPCIAAAEAGKHILCEKPMARSREEAQAMLNAVKKTGVKHMVSFNYRFVPAIRQAYELIKSGDLGEIITSAQSIYRNGLPTRTSRWSGAWIRKWPAVERLATSGPTSSTLGVSSPANPHLSWH
ncbi:MAG: Gfo/Idh/MocA family protein, partial [Ktedonobacteraceae bacterium]